ncbi:hypothetical protein [Lysobacter gummosus]|uniref:hypothetical protein n=1 Tax=Lysobacter gummosus TaxID=262324 RepID=UPI0036386C68
MKHTVALRLYLGSTAIGPAFFALLNTSFLLAQWLCAPRVLVISISPNRSTLTQCLARVLS